MCLLATTLDPLKKMQFLENCRPSARSYLGSIQRFPVQDDRLGDLGGVNRPKLGLLFAESIQIGSETLHLFVLSMNQDDISRSQVFYKAACLGVVSVGTEGDGLHCCPQRFLYQHKSFSSWPGLYASSMDGLTSTQGLIETE